MNDERRKQPRKSFELRIPFSVNDMESGRSLLYGDIADISASGLSLTSDHPLKPGQVLTFGNQRLTGIVRWCNKLDSAYRFGIKFI